MDKDKDAGWKMDHHDKRDKCRFRVNKRDN